MFYVFSNCNQIVQLYEFWRLYFLKMWLKIKKVFPPTFCNSKTGFTVFRFWFLFDDDSLADIQWQYVDDHTRPLAPPPPMSPMWHGVRVRPWVHLFPRVQLLHGSWRPRLDRREGCSIFWSHGLPAETGWKAQHPQWERERGADTDELHQEGEE